MRNIFSVSLLLASAAFPMIANGQEIPTDEQTIAIVRSADAFLATLTEQQRDAVLFDFTDASQRVNWSNFPLGGPGANRLGVKWGDLDDGQRTALEGLLGTVLSADGLKMMQEQMAADDIVAGNDTGAAPAAATSGGHTPPAGEAPAGGARPAVSFGSDYYFVSFLGEPSETQPWMLQFGGHHLAVNATVVGPDVTLSPTLTGGEPLKFTLDGKEVYIVEKEAVEASALLAELTDEQRATAIISDERADLVLGPGKDGMTLQPEGLAGADMTDAQKAEFLKVIEARLGILNADDLAALMAPIEANIEETYFAWWGPTDPVGAAYFRITGPTIILEFSPQANDGDPTDHAHNMYRDPTNEYGAAWTALD